PYTSSAGAGFLRLNKPSPPFFSGVAAISLFSVLTAMINISSSAQPQTLDGPLLLNDIDDLLTCRDEIRIGLDLARIAAFQVAVAKIKLVGFHHAPRARAHHHQAIAHEQCFLDAVGDEEKCFLR